MEVAIQSLGPSMYLNLDGLLVHRKLHQNVNYTSVFHSLETKD